MAVREPMALRFEWALAHQRCPGTLKEFRGFKHMEGLDSLGGYLSGFAERLLGRDQDSISINITFRILETITATNIPITNLGDRHFEPFARPDPANKIRHEKFAVSHVPGQPISPFPASGPWWS